MAKLVMPVSYYLVSVNICYMELNIFAISGCAKSIALPLIIRCVIYWTTNYSRRLSFC